MDKINVVGLGYIGLPTAMMLATHGLQVVGTDYNPHVVSELNDGQITFEEDGMQELYDEAIKAGIVFRTEYVSTSMYIISVPTPYQKENKQIDASYVIRAVENVMDVANEGAIIIIESTVSPGTIDRYIRPVIEKRGYLIGTNIHIVHAPERIIPGNMVYELSHNARTIGVDDMRIGDIVKDVYARFCKAEIVVTDIKTAEMTKVVENTFRDINIAFANELTKICNAGGMDVREVIRIANKHPRVNILSPGPGVGGHCISVDPWFLVGDYPGLANIILTARKINDSMPEYVLKRTYEIMKEHHITSIRRVGLYGLTYKENVDDCRESPTLQLLDMQKKHLAEPLNVYDPYIKHPIVEHQFFDLDEFLRETDFIVIMVAHDEIRHCVDKLADKIILDTRNIPEYESAYKL